MKVEVKGSGIVITAESITEVYALNYLDLMNNREKVVIDCSIILEKELSTSI